MKNILFACRYFVPLALFLLQTWQAGAAYRDTNDFCKGAPCHTGTAGTVEGVPLSEADDKVHDSCNDCHDSITGQLIGSAAGREGNAVNMCIDCHGGSARFLTHLHHNNLNKVSYDDGINDTSQSGKQGCQDCHGSGPQGGPYSLGSWSDILFEHNNSCYTCHDYANEPGVGDNTPFLADVQAAIANPGTGVTCATCHVPKVPDGSHGSHGISDFVRTGNCTTACHPSPDGIGEMHVTLRGDCGSCHQNTSGGGDLVASITGATTSSSCADCHGSTDPATVHHSGSSAQAGNCTVCHTDPRETNNITTYSPHLAHAPYQPACGYCHVDVSGNDVQVKAITVGIAGSTATGTPGGNTRTLVPGHQFTITSGTGVAKITNYGVCFDCHGQTGYAADKAGVKTALGPTNGVTPFHGAVTYGAAGTQLGGQGKGLTDDVIFRIGNMNGDLAANKAYWGPGRGVWNIRNAERSIQDHYLNTTPVADWKVNLGGFTDDYTNNSTNAAAGRQTAGGTYTFTRWYSRNGGGYVAIPVVDSDYANNTQCSSSCDTITIDVNTVSKGGTGFVGRVLHVVASSSNTSAQLYAVFGGEEHTMSCSAGDCTLTVDYTGEAAMEKWDGSNITDNTLYVISDKGGSKTMSPINSR